jgi:outer membrane protein TolC
LQKAYNSDYTFHDELIELLRKESQAELKVAQSHSDVDLALLGTYQNSGRANSEKDAIDNYNNDKKDSYSVTLQMSVPLGSSANKSEKSLVMAKQSSYNAQILQLENELTSVHEKLINSIKLLAKGLEIQQSNSKNLEINTAEVRRKFNQGRIPVISLIAEQDLLFQSELQEISLKRQIAYAVLEYFTVFNQFPCSWNNLK